MATVRGAVSYTIPNYREEARRKAQAEANAAYRESIMGAGGRGGTEEYLTNKATQQANAGTNAYWADQYANSQNKIADSIATKNAANSATAGVATGALNPIIAATQAGTNNTGAGAGLGAVTQADVLGNLIGNAGGGNGGGNGGASYYDPSADLLAAYNARQAALQRNYEEALAQQRRAYENSVNDLRGQGDDALRQAYINMMMNRRGLNQSLEAAGLRGGASESAMANLYNRYAGDRNSIARDIEQRLADLGNTYGNNVANLGMNYGTNGADAMADYYSAIANARQSLANTLARSSSNSKGTKNENSLGLNTDYVDVLKGLAKTNPLSAVNYAKNKGLDDDYLYAAGVDPSSVTPISSVDNEVSSSVLGELDRITSAARSNNTPDATLYNMISNAMQRMARNYGLTEEQARYYLAQAGY